MDGGQCLTCGNKIERRKCKGIERGYQRRGIDTRIGEQTIADLLESYNLPFFEDDFVCYSCLRLLQNISSHQSILFKRCSASGIKRKVEPSSMVIVTVIVVVFVNISYHFRDGYNLGGFKWSIFSYF